MSRTVKELSVVEINGIKEPGLHWIRDNLYLNVTGSGTRSWLYRFMLNGKSRAMGLGSFPKISLAAAQRKVSALRRADRQRDRSDREPPHGTGRTTARERPCDL